MEIIKLKAILAELVSYMENVVPYASAFASTIEGRRVGASSYDKSVSIEPKSGGVTLTCFTGNHFVERSVSDVSQENLKKTADLLLADCQQARINKDSKIVINAGEKISQDFYVEMQENPLDLNLAETLDLAQERRIKIQKLHENIVNCGVRYSFDSKQELFVNRHKTLFQELNRWTSMFYAVFSKDGKSSQIWGGHSLHGGAEHRHMDESYIKKSIADGALLMDAERIKPGTYDCIFSPEMSGMFAHEAFGHGTETDMYLKNRAKGKEYMQKQVASKIVNMYDDANLFPQSGAYYFDNEGNMATSTQIIKDGILVSGMTDLNSATRLNYKPTPNSRRESYNHKVYARMTNTYFAGGGDTLNEMIASIKHGFLVDYPSNGMEDPKGWGIQFEGMYAREIVNGKLTDKYFTPVLVTGYVPDMLMSISMLGTEVKMAGLGMCGKGDKEWVKVSDGGPYMKLKARLA